MNILMLTSRYSSGYGMGHSAKMEAEYLVKLGHSVTVVHSNFDIVDHKHGNITLRYFKVSRFPVWEFFIFWRNASKLLRQLVNKNKYDVVYIQSLEFGLIRLGRHFTSYYFARSTIRALRKVQNNEKCAISMYQLLVDKLLIQLEKKCMHQAKKVFTKSFRMKREINKLYNIDKRKITVITGGLNMENYNSSMTTGSEALQKKFNLPPLPILLFAGRLEPQKGVAYLIEALQHPNIREDFCVVIAGSGSKKYVSYLQEEIKKINNKLPVYFLGYIPQELIAKLISIANCVISPSLYEPFGMINLQAAALNKYIITTLITGSVEILGDYSKIDVISPRSSIDIVHAIKRWIHTSDNFFVDSSSFNDLSWYCVAKQLELAFKNARNAPR